MVNEVAPSTEGLEEGGGVRQDITKVTEEAVRRVQDNQKKAKQTQQQIKQDKDENQKLAKFLGFLLQNIRNDKLITALYESFFKTKHPKTNLVYLRKSINTVVIVGMFAPFYPEEIEKIGLKGFFDKIYSFEGAPTITSYIQYLKLLSKTYHDNIPIDKTAFINFLSQLLINYELVNKDKTSPENVQELQLSLSKELYGK